MKQCMIDLETMGTSYDAAIVSIGARCFHIEHEQKHPAFYECVQLKSCFEAGLTVTASTIEWWMKQNDFTRSTLFRTPAPLREALFKLSRWYRDETPKDQDSMPIWCHATFDMPILTTAFDRCGLTIPWHYRDTRDLRTLTHLYGKYSEHIKPDESQKHNALYDVDFQIEYTRHMLAYHQQNDPAQF